MGVMGRKRATTVFLSCVALLVLSVRNLKTTTFLNYDFESLLVTAQEATTAVVEGIGVVVQNQSSILNATANALYSTAMRYNNLITYNNNYDNDDDNNDDDIDNAMTSPTQQQQQQQQLPSVNRDTSAPSKTAQLPKDGNVKQSKASSSPITTLRKTWNNSSITVPPPKDSQQSSKSNVTNVTKKTSTQPLKKDSSTAATAAGTASKNTKTQPSKATSDVKKTTTKTAAKATTKTAAKTTTKTTTKASTPSKSTTKGNSSPQNKPSPSKVTSVTSSKKSIASTSLLKTAPKKTGTTTTTTKTKTITTKTSSSTNNNKEDPWSTLVKKHNGFNSTYTTLFDRLYKMHGDVFKFGEGGREMMDSLLLDMSRSQSHVTVLEIGVWLGQSTGRWLRIASNVRVIGVDPFTAPRHDHAKLSRIPQSDRAEFGKPHFNKALASYVIDRETPNARNRTLLLQGLYPQAAKEILVDKKVPVDVLYIDGGKTHRVDSYINFINRTIKEMLQVYPNVVVSGDDWTHDSYKDDTILFHNAMKSFSRYYKRNLYVAKERTWIMTKELPPDIAKLGTKMSLQ